MIFLDASVLLAAEDLDDSNHEAAVALLTTGALGTLDLAAYEVTNVAEARWRDPQASQRLRERVWAIGELGALVRIDRTLVERTAELPRRHTLSAYDAAYVAGAERIGAALASCDQRDLVSRRSPSCPANCSRRTLVFTAARPAGLSPRSPTVLTRFRVISHRGSIVLGECVREGPMGGPRRRGAGAALNP